MSEIICQTINLSKKYKGTAALDQVNIQVRRGDIYGLIGENGAGKSTLLKIIAGLSFASEGEIELLGKRHQTGLAKSRGHIGCLIEAPALYGEMSAEQNLEVHRIQRGIPGKDCINEVLKLVKLDQTGSKRVKYFSLGMKQRLGLAIALLGDPELLILDEPVNGLDPTGIEELRNILIKLNKEKGTTIMISSHILSELHKFVSCYGIIHGGKVMEQLTAEELGRKCQKHIYLKVNDPKKAVCLLENSLGIKHYEVCPNQVIKIYEKLNQCFEINKELALNQVYLEEITLKGDSLESYFSKVIGGSQHV